MHPRTGFTLVELSIVLVIIGLLIGGILGGQELIRASELNSITADVNKYKVVMNAFKLKYNALPGDMTNATSYWPSDSLTNGDGNAIISLSPEGYMAWKEMGLAGIIPGSFSGASGPGHATSDALVGTNVPALKVTGVGATWLSMGTQSSSLYYFDGSYGNSLFIGTDGGSNSYTQGPAFLSTDASSIDVKTDDGMPGSGNIVTWLNGYSYMSSGISCASSSSAYNLTATIIACPLIYKRIP